MDRLIIDTSSILRACAYAGTDIENGYKVKFEGKDVAVNSAEYAYNNFLVSYASVLQQHGFTPRQTVLVLDGMDSRSLRRAIHPDYKGNRPKRAPEINEEFNQALEGVIDELTGLGALCVHQDLMEADDVIAYLSLNLEGRKMVWSRDGDMLGLQKDDVDILLDSNLNPDVYKSCPAEYVTLYKSLVGDTSDNIKGCKGFGEKAFVKLMINRATELDDLIEEIKAKELHNLDLDEYPDLKLLVANADMVYTSWACAQFYPERVNTNWNPLEVRAQVVSVRDEWHHTLSRFAPTKQLITDPAKLSGLIQMLKKTPEVALDIEASTPDESDTWIANIMANKTDKKRAPFDTMGFELTGMSLTFGNNMQHTVYLPVDHAGGPNLTGEQVCNVVEELPEDVDVLIHNTAFELPALYNEWGGWVQGAVDTVIMKSYVDENTSGGLKPSVKQYFGYKQQTFDEVTMMRGPIGTLPEGGKPVKKATKKQLEEGKRQAVPEGHEELQYKMNQLTAAQVFDYGCDDTICTAALGNRLRFTMELEHTWGVFREVELPAQYWVAEAFVKGIDIDWVRLAELEAEDAKAYVKPAKILDDYLRKIQWRGCNYIPFELTNEGVRLAFGIFMPELEPLKTSAKTEKGLIAACRKAGAVGLADQLAAGNLGEIDESARLEFVSKPDFDIGKAEHKRELFYETMGLPIRFRTRVTDGQRAKGQKDGTPQTDTFAVDHFLKLDLDPTSEEHKVLSALRTMDQINTRQSLYYTPYPLLRHWKTGKIHPSLGQSKAATRRFTPNNPNVNQLPKKGEGKKVREIVRAPKGQLVCAMDFKGQELRLAAERSQDENLLSCYVGDNLKDPHSLTATGIAVKRELLGLTVYEQFERARSKGDKVAKATRDTAKTVNFSTQYLCMPPKLAKTLVCSVEDAADFIEAKNEVYFGLHAWQLATIEKSHEIGYTSTLMGARRHLHHKLSDNRKFVALEAERQGVNYEIQGSGGEQTKLSINDMWMAEIFERPSTSFIMPVHDEAVFLVPEDPELLIPCLKELHGFMVQKYSTMEVPAESDISIGDTFGTLIEVGDTPTDEAILEALNKVKEARCG